MNLTFHDITLDCLSLVHVFAVYKDYNYREELVTCTSYFFLLPRPFHTDLTCGHVTQHHPSRSRRHQGGSTVCGMTARGQDRRGGR